MAAVAWLSDADAAFGQSKSNGKPLLLYFSDAPT